MVIATRWFYTVQPRIFYLKIVNQRVYTALWEREGSGYFILPNSTPQCNETWANNQIF